jgi:preprotein translocase subunit SecD
MRQLRLLAGLAAVVACFTAMAKKPEFTVRFHVETTGRDTDRFSQPVALKSPPRQSFVEKTPVISERQIAGVYIYPAPDGSFAAVFKLDGDGRIALESVTTQKRGRALVAYVGTKKGSHQVTDMMIDRPVLDGILVIQQGLTALEAEALKKQFKPVLPKGAAPSTPEPKKKKGLQALWIH